MAPFLLITKSSPPSGGLRKNQENHEFPGNPPVLQWFPLLKLPLEIRHFVLKWRHSVIIDQSQPGNVSRKGPGKQIRKTMDFDQEIGVASAAKQQSSNTYFTCLRLPLTRYLCYLQHYLYWTVHALNLLKVQFRYLLSIELTPKVSISTSKDTSLAAASTKLVSVSSGACSSFCFS